MVLVCRTAGRMAWLASIATDDGIPTYLELASAALEA